MHAWGRRDAWKTSVEKSEACSSYSIARRLSEPACRPMVAASLVRRGRDQRHERHADSEPNSARKLDSTAQCCSLLLQQGETASAHETLMAHLPCKGQMTINSPSKPRRAQSTATQQRIRGRDCGKISKKYVSFCLISSFQLGWLQDVEAVDLVACARISAHIRRVVQQGNRRTHSSRGQGPFGSTHLCYSWSTRRGTVQYSRARSLKRVCRVFVVESASSLAQRLINTSEPRALSPDPAADPHWGSLVPVERVVRNRLLTLIQCSPAPRSSVMGSG